MFMVALRFRYAPLRVYCLSGVITESKTIRIVTLRLMGTFAQRIFLRILSEQAVLGASKTYLVWIVQNARVAPVILELRMIQKPVPGARDLLIAFSINCASSPT